VTSHKPVAPLPELRPLGETIKGYEVVLWWGLLGPRGLQRDLVAVWNKGVEQTLQTKEMQERLATEGVDPIGGPPERFRSAIRRDVEKWNRVVKQAKISVS